MAVKKIKLDFSKVEERSGWNTRHMPEGLHEFKVTGVEETEASDGIDMLVYSLVPTSPKYKSRNFPFYCKLQQNQLWKLRDLATAAGLTVPKKVTMFDPNAPVGKLIAAEVADGTGQYAERSEINGTYGLDILDDDGTTSGDDEDEPDDEDVDDEDEGEEDADLESMSLPELRTLAKSLGIATAGLKKDDLIDEITDAQADEGDEEGDDEDDLDDEDLADEEDEEDFEDDDDEEDEPEPAPRRRAAAKPAAKAAPARRAPAAKAAPARRVVRR